MMRKESWSLNRDSFVFTSYGFFGGENLCMSQLSLLRYLLYFSMAGKYLRTDNRDTVIAAISGRLELRDCHNMMLPFAP